MLKNNHAEITQAAPHLWYNATLFFPRIQGNDTYAPYIRPSITYSTMNTIQGRVNAINNKLSLFRLKWQGILPLHVK